MTIVDDMKLIEEYRRFADNVSLCLEYLIVGDKQRAYPLIALTAGQSLGIASRIGIEINKIQPPKPWEEIGISRSTYYRDQRRSKLNERPTD